MSRLYNISTIIAIAQAVFLLNKRQIPDNAFSLPSHRIKNAGSFYRGGNSLYIAAKSAVSKIRSFVSPVINSLPNSSNRSVTCQGFFGEILKHSEPNAKSFSRSMKEAVTVSLYKKSHGKPLISRGF